MTECKVVCLSQKDVIEIIANCYSVDENAVSIDISSGDPQYPQLSMTAEVKIEAKNT